MEKFRLFDPLISAINVVFVFGLSYKLVVSVVIVEPLNASFPIAITPPTPRINVSAQVSFATQMTYTVGIILDIM